MTKSTRTLVLPALGLAAAVGLSTLLSAPAHAAPLSFSDPVLLACVERSLGEAPTAENIASLSTLDCAVPANSDQVRSLEGMQAMTSLQYVHLQNQRVSDLTPLADLPALRNVWLDGNKLTDISPLARLKSLQILAIQDNEVSDISALGELPDLRWLDASENHIGDWTAARNVTFLTGKNQTVVEPRATAGEPYQLNYRGPSDSAMVLTDTAGTALTATSTPIAFDGVSVTHATEERETRNYVARFEGIDNIGTVDINVTQEVAIFPGEPVILGDESLGECLSEQLDGQAIGENTLAELTELSCAPGTEPIESLEGLENLVNLRTLSLADNHISDLTPLAALPVLSSVDVAGNRVTDASVLAPSASLRTLVLDRNGVSDLSAFAQSDATVSAVEQSVELADAMSGEPFALPLRDARGLVPTPVGLIAGATFADGAVTYGPQVALGRLPALRFANEAGTFSGSAVQTLIPSDRPSTLIPGNPNLGDLADITDSTPRLSLLAPGTSRKATSGLALTGMELPIVPMGMATLALFVGAALLFRRRPTEG
ncbi:leucine-rich repeat domain-containing protein [Mycetocola spongiae]|uniref:leucine-rich repeat domain-containing protein n=1 Tax=Mycetocola spongiae TaxID=2859226 RepID=UPI001CF29BF0|nr:leucine-rich repeat domain-containing protein [Mycetocola spongiae]UCR89858.1 leucine-rich repeat domain-containing protein [Mycetocola spongiae]